MASFGNPLKSGLQQIDAKVGCFGLNFQAAAIKGLNRLRRAGVRKIMVFNLSDLGITPAFSQDPAESTYATAWSTVFNETLISSWAMFESTFSGPLYIINAFAAFDAIAGERLNTTDAYLPNGLLAGLDSDDFVYREGEHPTTRAHHMLAGIAATSIASVPEPAVLTFLGAAIVVLAGLGRQKLFKR